jgi:pimeloyl-ACP methyl ester carboxylesterase
MGKKKRRSQLSRRFQNFASPSREYYELKKDYQDLLAATPQGNGAPVLVIPAFGVNDRTTLMLRNYLSDKGYKVYGWDTGLNFGPTERTVKGLLARFEQIYRENGKQKITLIGHSLGGILARELARDYPGQVAQVITMGSPFGLMQGSPDYPQPWVKSLFELIHYKNPRVNDAQVARQVLLPPPVPTTAIYTRKDAVAYWRASINPKAPRAENVEVDSSHFGLIVNKGAYLVIADRLAQDPSNWQPFDAAAYKNKQGGLDALFFDPPRHHSYTPNLDKTLLGRPHRPVFKSGPK